MTRQEQKEERRLQILRASLELFVTRGYSETKISDIAQKVGMSTGLLFHYFSSKDELYIQLLKTGMQYASRLDSLNGLEPLEYFTKTLEGLFAFAGRERWVFYMFILMSQARRPGMPEQGQKMLHGFDMIRKSASVIQKGQRQGTFRQGDPAALASCFWAGVQGVMQEMAFDPGMPPPKSEWLLSILKA